MNTNDDTGRIIDLVKSCMPDGCQCACQKCLSEVAEFIVGELQSKYQLTPIETETK